MSETQEPPTVTPQSLVSEDRVRAALTKDKGADAEILSFEVKDFTKKGDNYACVVTSAVVRYRQGDKEGEVTYVAKCNPCRNIAALNDFNAYMFNKEGNFYDKIVPLINAELKGIGQEPLRMANCYGTHYGMSEEVILLGDLRPDGFKMFDRKKGMDAAHTNLTLRELARLHAASTLVQAKMTEPIEEKYPFIKKDFVCVYENPDKQDEDLEQMMGTVFYTNMKTGMAMAQKINGYEKVVDWLKKHARQTNDLLKKCLKSTSDFNVVCHGDCWNNNILFKYDESGKPVDVRLLDLQICRKASLATDLNYLLYSSLEGQVRKNNLEAFMKTYYESFSQVLSNAGKKTPFTLDELKKEYHNQNLFGLLMCLMVVPFVVAEGNDVMDFLDMTDDMEENMKVHQQRMLDQLDNNQLLRPRLLATFDEMVEYGVIS
ncbi:uncharacterized protein LOC126985666 [Eriocheir sinensis]|uniref:uncharacterized protein LOC126985666 n=1 Tax=Eriocheir sinensis TaxID=95602 RepID=UPI0021CAB45A|nr:uncharacterized protein LOC126985666 [Eriocheir sinensis]